MNRVSDPHDPSDIATKVDGQQAAGTQQGSGVDGGDALQFLVASAPKDLTPL